MQVAPISIELDDSTIKHVHDYKPTTESTVPMFVQHTEAMLEEIDRMVFRHPPTVLLLPFCFHELVSVSLAHGCFIFYRRRTKWRM